MTTEFSFMEMEPVGGATEVTETSPSNEMVPVVSTEINAVVLPTETPEVPISTETPTDTIISKDIKPEDLPGTPVEDIGIVEETPSDPLLEIANGMLTKGYFRNIPEGVDPNNFNEEGFWKIVDHSYKERVEQAVAEDRQYLANSISDTTKDILSYNLNNPNMSEEEILDFMEARVSSRNITNLDPEVNGEDILRKYYGALNWTATEIDEKISTLVESNTLVAEATILKPKLDAKAQEITQTKLKQQQLIQEQETRLHNDLKARATNILKTGKLNGVTLSKEEIDLIWYTTMNQDVDVPVRGGKTMKLGMMEALVHKNRYDSKNGSLENLMLASLVLHKGPEAIERFFKQKAETTTIERFVRESKNSANRKLGGIQTTVDDNNNEAGLFTLRLS